MTPPLVTCIVAVYNGERFVAEALDSILAQTHRPLELIVVDDGSTDGTPERLERYGGAIDVVRQANAGPAAARNRALERARGAYVAFLDADDLWHPAKIEKQLARFDARPELGISLTLVRNFWAPELRDEEARFRDHRLSQPAAGYSTVALLARRSVFETVGPFDAAWRHIHDTEWFVRAGDAGVVAEVLQEVLVSRRLHPHSRSRLGAQASRDEYLQLMQRRIRKDSHDQAPRTGVRVRS